MSHFTVLVITDKPDQVEAALQPFHEFECTGHNDQYIQDIDETEEAREGYEKDTETMLKAGDGTLHSFFTKEGDWDARFSKPAAKRSEFDVGDRRERFVPSGYTEVTVPTSDIETFAQYIEGYYGREVVPYGEQPDLEDKHKYGYITVNENGDAIGCINRTNPNAKWDWWQTGGRWSGLLKPKDPAIGEKGSTGLMGGEYDPKGVDQCIKSNVDFEGRMKESGDKAAEEYDKAHEIIAGRTFKPWKQCREDAENIDAARDFYNGQSAIQDLKKIYDSPFAELDGYMLDRDKFIDQAANSAIATFAVLKDGKWYERGEMGWFACVSDEKEKDAWNGEFKALIDTVSDDACLTVVDCHI